MNLKVLVMSFFSQKQDFFYIFRYGISPKKRPRDAALCLSLNAFSAAVAAVYCLCPKKMHFPADFWPFEKLDT